MTRASRTRRHAVIVFTEGEATEVSYVDAIKRLQSAYVVRVDDRHGGPDKLVPLAIATVRELYRIGRAEATPEAEVPQVWCFFDHDQHPDIDDLTRRATDAGVHVAFSHPCFELWLLLHHEDYGAPAGGACATVTSLVKAHLPQYPKRGKRIMLADVAGRYEQARDRARRLARQHERDGNTRPTKRDPSTDVWRFVETIGVGY